MGVQGGQGRPSLASKASSARASRIQKYENIVNTLERNVEAGENIIFRIGDIWTCLNADELVASEAAGERRDVPWSRVYQTVREIQSLTPDLGNEQSLQL